MFMQEDNAALCSFGEDNVTLSSFGTTSFTSLLMGNLHEDTTRLMNP
jgi:hypothetical protein